LATHSVAGQQHRRSDLCGHVCHSDHEIVRTLRYKMQSNKNQHFHQHSYAKTRS